jgi:ATP-dependent protease ClpP protease subunit
MIWMAVDASRLNSVQIEILAKHTDKTPEEIELAIARPKYMSPQQAVEFNIIDKVSFLGAAFMQRFISHDCCMV